MADSATCSSGKGEFHQTVNVPGAETLGRLSEMILALFSVVDSKLRFDAIEFLLRRWHLRSEAAAGCGGSDHGYFVIGVAAGGFADYCAGDYEMGCGGICRNGWWGRLRMWT
jgi:hypothetical protein